MSGSSTQPKSVEGRVLILAPIRQDAVVAQSTLAEVGITAEVARGIFDLCHWLEQGCGAVLIAEEAVAESSLTVLVDLISRQPPWSDLPIIVITGSGQLSAASSRVYKAFGPRVNIVLMERPFRKVTLVSTVQSALRSRQRQYETRDLIAELASTADALKKNKAALEERAEQLAAAQEKLRQHALELEQRVAERTAELEETNQQLNAFCYTVAHDLRAPLRAQRGYANVVAEEFGNQLSPKGAAYVAKISAAAEKLEKLVCDLLTYATLTRRDLPLAPVDLAAVVDAVLLDLAEQFTATNARVIVGEVGFVVSAHQTSLVLVLTNLISNALKYVVSGQPPRIELKAERNHGVIRLWVADNGIGIAPEYHEKIFDVFERLHRRDVYAGTGIGLAIVRSGMRRMAGACGVESALGHGSRFWIELREHQPAAG